MNNEATIATWDLLQDFGFRPDDGVVAEVRPRLSFDFGNFKLSASCVTNPRFVEVVLFTGVLATRDSLAEVIFELPRRVRSRNQCAAWIVWNLDQDSEGRVFKPARHVRWIQEGRQNQKLLPWVAEMAAYRSRPQCTVQRDWLRLALKKLEEHLSSLPDDGVVAFSFDGSVFSIRCDKKVIAFPGEGLPWTVCFIAEAKALRRSPKRLMHEYLDVSVWESRIRFGSWSYEGAVGPAGGGNFSRVQ